MRPGSIERLRQPRLACAGAMMVLALKLITAGVSYQDGLKKPEVPRLCLHIALQPPKHIQMPMLWEWQLLAFVWGSVCWRTMRISRLIVPTDCVHRRSCHRISSGTG